MRKDTKLRIEDLAMRYKRHHVTIRRWMVDTELGFPRPIKLRGRCYFNLADLEAFEDQFPDRFGARP